MNKEQKIESILNSLEGMEASAPRPYFFTRLQARLDSPGKLESVIRFISRPAVALTAVLFIVLINAFAILSLQKPAAQNAATFSELAAVDEYMQISNNVFDTEKPNP